MNIAETAHHLISDKKEFDSYVYTPWEKVMTELSQRESDEALQKYVDASLPHGIPEPMRGKKSMVLFRHIATPNYEINRFMSAADSLHQFKALILEYTDDQFNDRNEGKYFLGKLRFHKGLSKDGQPIFENVGVINFNDSNKKPISGIATKWGQNFVDFHHELFDDRFKSFPDSRYDLSSWLHTYGPSAKEYYKSFLTLFLKDGILFENLFINAKEQGFTETVILPAFLEIEKETGHKPLIVTLAPTEMEADAFWYSYPHPLKATINEKMGG